MHDINQSLDSINDSVCRISAINHNDRQQSVLAREEIDRQLVRIMMTTQSIMRAMAVSGQAAGVDQQQVAA